MKGGDGFRTTGKKISVALLALVLMTLLLWDWETNPFVYTHVSTQYQSNTPPEPMEPAETKTDGNKYQSLEKEEGKEPMENGDDFEAEMIDGSFVNETASVDTKVCNYARGRWVADSRPPLYAAQCKYMERKWACRLSSRTDFSYEGYRWQSVDCQKPEFEASHFLER
ncbi:protein trichome birefringence-like 16 [Gossypium arboreum]|uniref:protein trichome birefringence-like 16 n=1 Tax=Gossypium arboreum TaxID=29729 RepID=UPI0022F1D8AC|nr:protein trichome birefringence-like 16 [Gossypium arboreum]XP_052882900.1 protein trichome birefringence-like 16 [Gossypium arboreum]